MEAIATTTHVGGKMFSEVGGGGDKQMLSRQRREIQSIAHSQPRRSGKEWVDYASKIVWVLMTITSFHFSSHLIMSRRNAAIKQQSDTGSDQQSIIKTLVNGTCIGHKPI